jgi:hypothetical protein
MHSRHGVKKLTWCDRIILDLQDTSFPNYSTWWWVQNCEKTVENLRAFLVSICGGGALNSVGCPVRMPSHARIHTPRTKN